MAAAVVMVEEAATDCCPICYDDFENANASAIIDLEAAPAMDGAASGASFLKQRVAIADGITFSSSCPHAFCRACLRDYCKHAILTRQIPIPCPARAARSSTTNAAATAHVAVPQQALNVPKNTSKKSKFLPKRSSSSSSMMQLVGNNSGGCQAILSEALIREVLREPSSPSSRTQSARQEDEQKEEEEVGGDNHNSNFHHDESNDDNDACNSSDSNPYWVKYQRFQKLVKDPSLVACPLCNELVGVGRRGWNPRDGSNNDDGGDDDKDEEMGHAQASGSASAAAASPRSTSRRFGTDNNLESSSTSAALLVATSSWSKLQRFCSDCNLEFCAQHGHLLHAPHADACFSYTRNVLQQQEQFDKEEDLTSSSDNDQQQVRQTEQVLRKYTKPCSHCGCRLQKFAGCDHVVCPACQQDMCFRCGTHAYLSSPLPPVKKGWWRRGNHTIVQQQQQPTNNMYRNCAECKQGFIDHRYAHRYQCRMLLCLPFYLPFMILYTAFVGLVILPLTCFFCCCCGCGRLVDNELSAPEPPPPPPRRTTRRRQEEQRHGRDQAERSAAATAIVHGEADEIQRGAQGPMRGITLATSIIFLPFLLVLHDFGWESDFVDGLFNNQPRHRHDTDSASSNNKNNVVIGVSEIPTMDLELDASISPSSNHMNATPDDVGDSDDDVSGIVELVNDDSRNDMP